MYKDVDTVVFTSIQICVMPCMHKNMDGNMLVGYKTVFHMLKAHAPAQNDMKYVYLTNLAAIGFAPYLSQKSIKSSQYPYCAHI